MIIKDCISILHQNNLGIILNFHGITSSFSKCRSFYIPYNLRVRSILVEAMYDACLPNLTPVAIAV